MSESDPLLGTWGLGNVNKQSMNEKQWRYVRIFGCVALFVLDLSMNFIHIQPHQKYYPVFEINDEIIKLPSYDHECSETISTITLIVICAVIPIIVNIILALSMYGFGPLATEDIVSFVLFLGLSIGVSGYTTIFIKPYAAMPRPCFFDMCDYNMDEGICTIDDEQWESFPSGHATLTAAGLWASTMYLMGKLNGQQEYQTILAFCMYIAIIFLSMTRVADYQHWPIDVTAGLIIGTVPTYIIYYHFYPPLSNQDSNVPISFSKALKEKSSEEDLISLEDPPE